MLLEQDVDVFLEHHGVKGMHWGVRKEEDRGGFRLQTSLLSIDPVLHASTKASVREMASLIDQRYGFHISQIKNLKIAHPSEYARGTKAYVEHTPGRNDGVVYVVPDDIRKELRNAEKGQWFATGTGNLNGLLTHESAHAMFHADQKVKAGFFKAKVVGSTVGARNIAIKAAVEQAKHDGISPLYPGHVSGYAATSGTREELEAEMFSQYHWSPNPPNFIKTWGETLHHELGIDPTPFRKTGKHG